MATTVTNGEFNRTTSGGYVKALSVATQEAKLFSFHVFSKNASTPFYVQLHDSVAPPTDLTNYVTQIPVYPDDGASYESTKGMIFKNGIYVFVSSSNTAATAISASDVTIVATWI